MKRFLTLTILVVFAIIAVACTTQPENTTTTMTSVVNKEENIQLQALKEEFAKIGGGNFLSEAMSSIDGPSTCASYAKYKKYESISKRFDSLGLGLNEAADFRSDIKLSTRTAGVEVASAAYSQMKTGQAISCRVETDFGNNNLDGTHAIKIFAEIIDQYGPEGADPKIVRAAYLKAAKADVSEALVELKSRPESSDLQGWIVGLAEEAKEWQFSPNEIGIPADLQKKLDL